jgi:hypothetical protein
MAFGESAVASSSPSNPGIPVAEGDTQLPEHHRDELLLREGANVTHGCTRPPVCEEAHSCGPKAPERLHREGYKFLTHITVTRVGGSFGGIVVCGGATSVAAVAA